MIYSAIYGRRAHEESICSAEAERVPPFGMLPCSEQTLQKAAQGIEGTGREKTAGTRALASWKCR